MQEAKIRAAAFVRQQLLFKLLNKLFELNAFIQCHDQRGTDEHNDKLANSNCEPCEEEWKTECEVQFNGNNEHCKRKDDRIKHHSFPDALNESP